MPLRIAICGMGVAGALAATLLAREGHDVRVFERSPVVGAVGAGLLLQPSGQGVLGRAGLLGEVLRDAQPIHELLALKPSRRVLVGLRYGDFAEGARGHGYGVHRAWLFDVLYRAAVAAGAKVHLGHEIVGYCESPGEVSVMRRGDAEPLGPFDLVLGCDGARSPLRQASPLVQACHAYPHGAAYAVLECREAGHDAGRTLLQVTRGTRELVGVLPTSRTRVSLFVGLPVGRFEMTRAAGLDAFKAHLTAVAPEVTPYVASLTSLAQFTFTPYYRVRMGKWHTGRVCFLGDAAHAMSPHLGQGVNLALLDAEALATAIAGGSRAGVTGALAAYEAARRPQTGFYASLSHRLTPFFQADGWWRGIARDVGLPLFPKVPWMRTQMLHTLSGTRTRWL